MCLYYTVYISIYIMEEIADILYHDRTITMFYYLYQTWEFFGWFNTHKWQRQTNTYIRIQFVVKPKTTLKLFFFNDGYDSEHLLKKHIWNMLTLNKFQKIMHATNSNILYISTFFNPECCIFFKNFNWMENSSVSQYWLNELCNDREIKTITAHI